VRISRTKHRAGCVMPYWRECSGQSPKRQLRGRDASARHPKLLPPLGMTPKPTHHHHPTHRTSRRDTRTGVVSSAQIRDTADQSMTNVPAAGRIRVGARPARCCALLEAHSTNQCAETRPSGGVCRGGHPLRWRSRGSVVESSTGRRQQTLGALPRPMTA
jgi:hypothetical protein